MSELENVLEASQPSDVPASSAEQAGVPAAPVETPTYQVEQAKEPPFHEHPRWKEVQEERNYWRDLAIKQADTPRQPQAPAPDPEAGMSPEEKVFWQKQRNLAREEALKVAQEREQVFAQQLNQIGNAVTAISYERFQQIHPDVRPDSPEENAIAQYFKSGVPLEDAYKIVMFDRLKSEKATQAKTVQANKTQEKLHANLETRSIPPISGVKEKPPTGYREGIKYALQKGGV